MTFAWIGARSLQALPFYLILVAWGLHSVQPRVRQLLSGLIILVFATAAINYYTNQEFHNPVYVIPSKEIARQVQSQAQGGDVIIAPQDSLFAYYYPANSPYALFDESMADQAQKYIVEHHSPRVWLVTVSRDRGRALTPSPFITWLESGYIQTEKWGYAEQSPAYLTFKEALIKREAYRFKAELFLYTKKKLAP
jgi:hypothetical protein